MGLQFDNTISLGTILQIVVMAASAAVLYARLTALEVKMEPLWKWFIEHTGDGRDLGKRG